MLASLVYWKILQILSIININLISELLFTADDFLITDYYFVIFLFEQEIYVSIFYLFSSICGECFDGY